MHHTISTDRRRLTISITEDERQELIDSDDIQSDAAMYDFLEPLTCNSELDWIRAEEIGALTDAPILGIRYGDSEIPTRDNDGRAFVAGAWAFMDYQVVSMLEVLLDKGQVTLTNGR